MAKREKMFSTSIGGFRKSEVVEFIEDINRKAKVTKESYEFEIARLESEVSELEHKSHLLEEATEKLSEYENKNRLLEDDVDNQRKIIADLGSENETLKAKVAELEKDYYIFKEKAAKYDKDLECSAGIVERARTEAGELLEKAKTEAREYAEKIKADSEKLIAENLKKVKYLYKRRDELLSAFEKVKNAAGGFYDNITSTLSSHSDD